MEGSQNRTGRRLRRGGVRLSRPGLVCQHHLEGGLRHRQLPRRSRLKDVLKEGGFGTSDQSYKIVLCLKPCSHEVAVTVAEG